MPMPTTTTPFSPPSPSSSPNPSPTQKLRPGFGKFEITVSEALDEREGAGRARRGFELEGSGNHGCLCRVHLRDFCQAVNS